MMLKRSQVSVFLGVAATVWLIVLVLQGTPVTWDHGRPFTVVVGVLVGLGFAFEHVLWRHRFLNNRFVKRPDLRGTWRVELQSSDVDPATDERVPMIVCYMAITQTYSKLEMHLMTPESKSRSLVANVRPWPNGNGYLIAGIYTNEPNLHLREWRISEMHQGALIIETSGSTVRPSTLTAKYWTDRKTTGTMDFTDRVDEVFRKFEEAHSVFVDST